MVSFTKLLNLSVLRILFGSVRNWWKILTTELLYRAVSWTVSPNCIPWQLYGWFSIQREKGKILGGHKEQCYEAFRETAYLCSSTDNFWRSKFLVTVELPYRAVLWPGSAKLPTFAVLTGVKKCLCNFTGMANTCTLFRPARFLKCKDTNIVSWHIRTCNKCNWKSCNHAEGGGTIPV